MCDVNVLLFWCYFKLRDQLKCTEETKYSRKTAINAKPAEVRKQNAWLQSLSPNNKKKQTILPSQACLDPVVPSYPCWTGRPYYWADPPCSGAVGPALLQAAPVQQTGCTDHHRGPHWPSYSSGEKCEGKQQENKRDGKEEKQNRRNIC